MVGGPGRPLSSGPSACPAWAHFPVVSAKMMRLWREEPDLDLADLAAITAPTLVMQGDDDVVTVEHSAAVRAPLWNGTFRILF